MSRRKKLYSAILTVAMLAVCVLFLFPIYAIFLASLKPGAELMRYGLNVRLDWDLMSLKNYAHLFSNECPYFGWFLNSILLTIAQAVICLTVTSIVGYGFAMYEFKGKRAIFLLVMLVMMIPVEIIILPLYKMMVNAKLMDNYIGVILPFVVAPSSIFFFRQFASGISKEFMYAGRVDGCTDYGIMFKIYFPIMLPAFGAMAILQGLNSWNAFLWPIIILRTNAKFTLPIGLSSLLSPLRNNYDVLVAGSVMSIVPVAVLFLCFQGSFIDGLTTGGIKG